jgi:uncharacterized protein YbjT (DUF2867 family)
MKTILLFGATGHLGKEIAKELARRNFNLTIVARSVEKAKGLAGITTNYIVADACRPESLMQITGNFDVIISALGKSVSLNDKSKPTFRDVDLEANTNILDFARTKGIKKFVYISAFHAERYLHLEYFNAHHTFSEKLKASGINYSIIKPPAIFSAFLDVIEMAKKKQLVNIGKGDKQTNPIYEGDLAKIVVDSMYEENATIEAGGQTIYTRRQLNEIINAEVNKGKKLRTVPAFLLNAFLPVIRLSSKNTFDKFAFFMAVMQHDTIAPLRGEMTFESYVRQKLLA